MLLDQSHFLKFLLSHGFWVQKMSQVMYLSSPTLTLHSQLQRGWSSGRVTYCTVLHSNMGVFKNWYSLSLPPLDSSLTPDFPSQRITHEVPLSLYSTIWVLGTPEHPSPQVVAEERDPVPPPVTRFLDTLIYLPYIKAVCVYTGGINHQLKF